MMWCAMVSGKVDGGMVSHGVVGGSSGGMVSGMADGGLVSGIMDGGTDGGRWRWYKCLMAHGDNMSAVMWCVGGECMYYGVCAHPTAI